MPFFEIQNDRLGRLARTSLSDASIHERRDLQRLLRAQLPELIPDLLVIAEEFGEWEESKRRIDLLALDSQANLVVIELKRGDTGHHMELQAVRYAAMVSTMTFEHAVSVYERHLQHEIGAEARTRILEFLGWTEPNEDEFAQEVRIVLLSEDFSRELTSSILWLNDKGLDITCFRMSAYNFDDRVLVDFQQIIPLKEAEDFQVKVRNKQQVELTARRTRVPWNGEYYANFGTSHARSWEDARQYGFISAGGGKWFIQTLNLLSPGARVWVNRPGVGYLGVGVVTGQPVNVADFEVQTDSGSRRYVDVAQTKVTLLRDALDPEKAEMFVPIRWIASVPEAKAIREPGFFGNQNSVAKPTTETWPDTVVRLKHAFSVND